MPEGPELHISSLFINKQVKGMIFSGKVLKSDVSKNPEIPWDVPVYTVRASSRGKEMKIFLQEFNEDKDQLKQTKEMTILFRFGMSGCFKFTAIDNIPKHAHLRFYTLPSSNKPAQVLSFVDFRRFGRWQINADWGLDRGPCPITDYENFRSNVINNLEDCAFKNKAICEVLLNQKYFNGIGNYLRAEILFRAKIPPFEDAYTSLLKLRDTPSQIKVDNTDFGDLNELQDPLHLCHAICREVLQLSDGYDVEHGLKEDGIFEKWLQCYQNPNMKSLIDRNKRTIWFDGEPGPLVPKVCQSRQPRKKRKTVTNVEVTERSSSVNEELNKNPKIEPEPSIRLTRSKTRRSPRFRSSDVVLQVVPNAINKSKSELKKERLKPC